MNEETLAAILAEMRSITTDDWATLTPRMMHDLADRIEAAAEREFLKVSAQKVSEMTACNFRPYADGTAALAAVERHLDSIENSAKGVYDAIVRDDWLMARSLSDEIMMSVSRAKSDANNLYMKDSRNAAAIREALETVLENHDRMVLPEICCPNCGEDFQLRGNLPPDITRKVKAALAAPARNCDRFADELDAQLAFLNDVWLISVDKNTMLEKDKFENWTEQMKTRYGRWLLAPVEGGAE